MARTAQEEVDLNYEAFQKELPRLLHEHRGKFALLKDGRIINFFSSAEDARNAAASFIPDGLYSIQQVTDMPVNLGFYTHAVPVHPV